VSRIAVVTDERVGVGRIVGHRPLLVRRVGLTFAIIVAQIVRFEWFGERQLLRMPDAELLAQRHDGVERLDAEIHPAIQVAQIWQLDAQRFVHGSEMQQSIRLDAILIQRRTGPRQPTVPGWPPKSVIRPIRRNI
jgi:hypothetical protein